MCHHFGIVTFPQTIQASGVGSQLMTGRIWLMTATKTAGIAITKKYDLMMLSFSTSLLSHGNFSPICCYNLRTTCKSITHILHKKKELVYEITTLLF